MADLNRVHVSNTRTAKADVTNAPTLYTAKGTRPLAPIWIEATYHIDSGRTWVTIAGQKLWDDGRKPWVTRRSYGSDECAQLPAWAQEFVDAHRPEGGGRR